MNKGIKIVLAVFLILALTAGAVYYLGCQEAQRRKKEKEELSTIFNYSPKLGEITKENLSEKLIKLETVSEQKETARTELAQMDIPSDFDSLKNQLNQLYKLSEEKIQEDRYLNKLLEFKKEYNLENLNGTQMSSNKLKSLISDMQKDIKDIKNTSLPEKYEEQKENTEKSLDEFLAYLKEIQQAGGTAVIMTDGLYQRVVNFENTLTDSLNELNSLQGQIEQKLNNLGTKNWISPF